MTNQETEAAWAYHDRTKHSAWSVRNDQHYMDFDNMPRPFKIYSDLEPLPLPRSYSETGVSALDAISTRRIQATDERSLDLETLASIFHYSAGITKKRSYPGGEILFRAAACTGALYHIELYLVCGQLPDLEPGVYHFGAHDFALRKLRQGDHRAALVEASGDGPAIAKAPATLIYTSTYWRNSWKYRDRAYRHCFWDSGTILANTLAICNSQDIPSRIITGFVDESVNRLLGLDTQREVAIALVPLGGTTSLPQGQTSNIPPLELNTEPLSKSETDYPAIREIHSASSLTSVDEAAAWSGVTPKGPLPAITGESFALDLDPEHGDSPDSIETVIHRRGSSRQFARRSITFAQLSITLQRATQGVPADFLDPEGVSLNHLYLIVHAVDGLDPGIYVFHRDTNTLELLRHGDFRQDAGYLGLEQAIPADASVDVFFMADLQPIFERFGNRGYRAALLEAGIIGGKLYLAAYAQRLGASGLTFFDDDVTNFFSPHAEGLSAMFLVALGVPVRRRVLS